MNRRNFAAILVLLAVLSPVPGQEDRDKIREKKPCRTYDAETETVLVYECDLCEVNYKGKQVNDSLLDAAEERCEKHCKKKYHSYFYHMYTACDEWLVNGRGIDVCKCSKGPEIHRDHKRFHS
ncbi:hypothetical protein HDE_02005 [Halotydeus destructor]|nr:hypothetical protein HDE_02005 [Halotydeus destructor]